MTVVARTTSGTSLFELLTVKKQFLLRFNAWKEYKRLFSYDSCVGLIFSLVSWKYEECTSDKKRPQSEINLSFWTQKSEVVRCFSCLGLLQLFLQCLWVSCYGFWLLLSGFFLWAVEPLHETRAGVVIFLVFVDHIFKVIAKLIALKQRKWNVRWVW